MTLEWISDEDRRWAMRCNEPNCTTQSEPVSRRPSLVSFQEQGWFVAKVHGDVCPACLARGVRPTVAPFEIREQ